MKYTIRPLTPDDAAAASTVVHASFRRLASDDWLPDAQLDFLNRTSPKGIAEKIATAAYAGGAFADDKMIGLVLMPAPNLVGLLFIDPSRLRQGIAQALWAKARAHIEAEFPSVETVELNATSNAIPFYCSLGFVPISLEFWRNGHRATRMACWLPARKHGAECIG